MLLVEPMLEADFNRVDAFLRQAQAENPEAWLSIGQAQGFVDADATADGTAGLIDLFNGLVDSLTGSGSAAARNIVSTLTETSNRIENQTGSETISVTGDSTTTTREDVVEFIDIMTPEEFLDNFQTAFNTYSDSLFRIGAVDRATYDFMLRNPEQFFTPYIAELGRIAATGVSPFEVVGLEGAAELLGERFGGAQSLEGTTVSNENRISDSELTEIINQTINRLTNTTADGIPQTVQETMTEMLTNVFKAHQETTTRSEFHNIASTFTIEQVFGRPNLTTVATLSPLDFLRDKFHPTTIGQLATLGEGGQQLTPASGSSAVPSAPRRLR